MRTKDKSGRLARLRARLRVLLRWRELWTVLLRFGVSALLTRAVLLEHYAPFPLGFVAASGSGAEGFAAMCGAVLGYLLGMGFSPALRYAASSILIYSIAFGFFDVSVYKKPWFMAVCAACVGAVTGFAYLSGAGWALRQFRDFLSEVALIGLSAMLFRELDFEERPMGRGGLLMLCAALTSALAQWNPSFSGGFAALATLTAARCGAGGGAMTGAVLGMAVGLSRGGTPLFAAVLSLAGALCGSVPRRNRLLSAGVFLSAGLFGLLWVHGSVSAAWQLGAGCALSLCLPNPLLHRVDTLMMTHEGLVPVFTPSADPANRRVRCRLEEQAGAYRSLHGRIQESLRHSRSESMTAVFECTARRLCSRCALYPICWKRNYAETRETLTLIMGIMSDRNRAEKEDYPGKFRARCLYLDDFIRISNEELRFYRNRRLYQQRLRSSRMAVCAQYLQLARLLEDAAADIGQQQETDLAGAAAVERGLSRLGFHAQVDIRLDERRRRTLELRGKNLSGLNSEEGSAAVSRILGARLEPVDVSRIRQGQLLVFQEAPPLLTTVAACSSQKEGQRVNGDTGTWFRDENGYLWVLLCDGMGSGTAAAEDSQLMTQLLEDFLHAGVDPTAALVTLTGALALRGEVSGGFTTVDLLSIDLFSGSAELFKLGGAPTYVRRKGAVSRVSGSALPAGLELDREHHPDHSRFRLGDGDFVVLLSDGITDGSADALIRDSFAAFHGESPRELGRTILDMGSAQDDRTVIVIKIAQRS